MTLLIAPIDKNGVRKVGLKIIEPKSALIKLIKEDGILKDILETSFHKSPFTNFYHFTGELRQIIINEFNSAKNQENPYSSIELTDGYDVQDKNIYIDYAHTPPRITIEDKEGLPTQLEFGRKLLTYKKPDGFWKYTVVKEINRNETYLDCIIIKDDKEQFRKFKVENIVSEVEE